MQRYQVNYKLLIGLVGGGVLLTAVIGGLYWYQYNRTADKLLIVAEQKRADGDIRGAAGSLFQYTRIRKNDEEKAVEMAMAFAEVAEMEDTEPRDRAGAIGIMEATVRRLGTNAELRRELVDLLMKFGGYKQAADHLQILVNSEPGDSELQSQLATCYLVLRKNTEGIKLCSQMIGYDPVVGKFDAEKATAPDEVSAYSLLAVMLDRNKVDQAEIDKVMDRVVEVNPEDPEAYVALGRHSLSKGVERREDAIAAIDKALELNPKHVDALVNRARLHSQDEQFVEATELINRGLEAEPDTAALYMTGAHVAAQEKGFEATLVWFDRGVEATSGAAQRNIKVAQARALINASKLDDARKLIKELRNTPNINPAILQYLEARLMVSEEKWYQAAKALEDVRKLLSGKRDMGEELNALQALCYTRLEQWDNVIDACERVLEQFNSKNRMATDLLANAKQKVGDLTPTKSSDRGIGGIVSDEMRKPAEEQNWDSVLAQASAYSDKMIEAGTMTESSKLLLLAEVNIRAENYKKAESLVRNAIKSDPENMRTWALACRLTAADPNGGAVKALAMLNKVVEKFGDQPLLRLDRAGLYMTLNDEDVIEQMLSVTEGMKDFSKSNQVMVWKGLATRFEALRAQDAVEQCRTKIAELAPNELANLLDMFTAALAKSNDAAMADAQEKILKIVGSKQDPNWLFTEANRLIALTRRGVVEKSTLDEAERLSHQVIERRQDWHMPYLLLADIAVQRRQPLEALKNLDRAAELGQPTAQSLRLHVSLLMQTSRFDDARKQLDRARPAFRERLFSREYAECLLKSRYQGERDKRWEESVQVARKAGELGAENGPMQLWLGRFLLLASGNNHLAESTREAAEEDSGVAFKKAVELTPKSEEAWMAYIGYLQQTKQMEAAKEAVRQVQLALDEDAAPVVLAVGHQILGRWFDAENVYLRALETKPDDLRLKQRLASFYLSRAYPLKDKSEKATPLINDILHAAADNPELGANSNVQWARRTAAKLLAQTGNYQKSLAGDKLLRSNVVNGQLSIEDRLTLAKILASRPEPESKFTAAEHFEDVQRTRDLSPADLLTLGQLYFATGQWEKCSRLMLELTSKNPDFVSARDTFIRMLLAHDEGRDLDVAARQLERLRKVAPAAPSTLELLVRISSKMGREQEVVPVLRKLLAREENRNNPRVIVRAATLLADLDDLDNAEKLFRAAAPADKMAKLSLANFLGLHRSMDDALDLLEQVEPEVGRVLTLQYASVLLKAKSDDIEPRHMERVEGWLTRALREDPESNKLLMQKAELLDTQKKYKEAGQVYRNLLARGDITGFDRAVLLNNLAYQLAMVSADKSTAEEAMTFVAEAVELLGPRSDILDTRAVVHMALGQPEAAVADMQLAVTDGPTASKYFHLSRAQMMARQPELAIKAWDKAVELGLSIEDVGTVERDAYKKLETQISELKQSITPRDSGSR